MKKITPHQIEKYDIEHKIVKTLCNISSRYVLFSIIDCYLDLSEISFQTRIPLSTVYKKLNDLEKLSLVHTKTVLENNREIKCYKSTIRNAHIIINSFKPKLALNRNKF